jgi:SAM-dependent methyltransferase
MKEIFEKIYQHNGWNNTESVSGSGSTLEETAELRRFLPHVLDAFDVKTMLDIPCGDFHWFSQMWWDSNLPNLDEPGGYIGADIVPELIKANKAKYPGVDFRVLDMTKDKLPQVDLILARDVLGHFSNRDVRLALANLRRSGSRYLLTTTFPTEETRGDIQTGQWRPINLASYFGMPNPSAFWPEINVEFPDGHTSTKGLGLWDLRSNR